MAMSASECQGMINSCQASNVSLSVAFYRRYFPVVEKMKWLVDDGAIGKPLRIHATTIAAYGLPPDAWRLDPAVGGGGFLMDMGTHRLDLFAHFFGEPTQIHGLASAQSWNREADDAATVAMEFAGGVHGSAVFHWNCPVNRDSLEIVGEEGIISTDSLSGAGNLKLEVKSGTQLWELPSSQPVHLNLVQKVVDHLLDGAPNPCPGEQAMIASRICDAIYRLPSD